MLDHAFVDSLIDSIIEKLETHAIRTGIHWRDLFEPHRGSLKLCESEHELEERVNAVLVSSRLSHIAFFGDHTRAVPSRMAIAATVEPFDSKGTLQWMFQDVHAGGPADQGGIKPGDLLVAIDGKLVKPPVPPTFAIGADVVLTIDARDGPRKDMAVALPRAGQNGRQAGTPPMVQPSCVTASRLDDDIAYLRVAFFPGASGRPFASALTRAFAQVGPCRKLLLDLRGNNGGFVGSLRLMGYLTPHRLPVGYSLTRLGQERGLRREQLMRVRNVPTTRLGEVWMYIRFTRLHKDRSLSLWTEGLGRKPFHGRIVMLVNNHTYSAAEIVAAFASENKLATLVGTRTGGQTLGGANYRVAERFVLRLPATLWHSWQGTSYEGVGISPDVEVAQSLSELQKGVDTQPERAKATLNSL